MPPPPLPSSKGGEKGGKGAFFYVTMCGKRHSRVFDMYRRRLAFAEAKGILSTAIGNVEGNID